METRCQRLGWGWQCMKKRLVFTCWEVSVRSDRSAFGSWDSEGRVPIKPVHPPYEAQRPRRGCTYLRFTLNTLVTHQHARVHARLIGHVPQAVSVGWRQALMGQITASLLSDMSIIASLWISHPSKRRSPELQSLQSNSSPLSADLKPGLMSLDWHLDTEDGREWRAVFLTYNGHFRHLLDIHIYVYVQIIV